MSSRYTDEERAAIEADRDHEIDRYRTAARDALYAARQAMTGMEVAVRELRANHIYDVEVAEGSGYLIEIAVSQVRVGLAALDSMLPRPGE